MKLILTGAYKYTNEQIEHLESLGFDIVYVPDEREPLRVDVSDIDAVICNGLFLYNSIEKFTNLKYIQLTSAGLDRVPIDYIKDHNIQLHNARGVYSVPMAEFALCGVLQLIKQSRFFYNNQKKHIWEKHRGLTELIDKTVCIVGAGSIGNEIAKRFKSFDANVIGVDLFPADNDNFSKVYSLNSLDEVLPQSDIIILALPLTNENEEFFNEEKFSLSKENAILVNISRGRLVNQKDLINAIQTKKISGAVLDVFEEEPLDDDSPLWDFENVILTPHNSFVGENNSKRMFDIITNNLKKFNTTDL